MDSKIKTVIFETTLRKPSPGSLRVPKLTRSSEPNSPSPTQRSRLSLDRSSANSETSSERRSRKVPTPPEKTPTRSVTGSSSIQLKEDLKKAKELIASLENDKALALEELEQVRKEAFKKLYESLAAQKMAEENFEIEKFKAVEAGVEAFHRKEEELKKELEIVKNQHASDSAVLLLVTRELEKVTQALAAANDDKNMLLSQAENASKSLAIRQEKVDILSSNLIKLKTMISKTREKETISNNEIAALKSELEKARCFEAKVKERGRIIEKLNGEVEDLMMAKSYANGSADQWCKKSMELEEELEGSKEEVEKLKTELETVNEREQDASSSLQILLEENSEIFSEMERLKEEEEKSKKAMESLASSLHEVSSEAREMKEKLLSLGSEDYETHVESLKLVIKGTNEKHEKILHEMEQNKKQFERSKVDWEIREAGLVTYVKKFDEEVYSMVKEMNRLRNLVEKTKEEADEALKKEAEMRDDLKEVEDEVSYLQETLREVRGESLKLSAKMLDKETEFQSVIHENDLLRGKENDSLKKINELSKLLEEALVKKDAEEDECESEQDYDLLPKVVEFSEVNGAKEDSSDGNDDDDDDTVEVEYSMLESYHLEKKETSL
ncbi:unnamed protein product [Eruca vesicaria subsp. sativa]|uniref:Uncharacterized protein n=1 Tax=Eruca vesicaria subsp. sativa TaxID=29727 RepID=A0ABC8JF53_ERUVS|nr:unnamed protein product [Eruca vesicaria subsp. sativa]